MKPNEVYEIISLLREAADTLALVMEDLDKLIIMPSTVVTFNGKLKLQIDKGVLSAESAIREALEPVEWIDK